MLTGLRRHPLLVGPAEVLTDAIRYVAIMLVVLMLLGQLARVACGRVVSRRPDGEHDGADGIERAWRDGLKPDPLLTVSEWADRYRVLSQRASSEPGRWRTERTPYLREIMDCLSPASPVNASR